MSTEFLIFDEISQAQSIIDAIDNYFGYPNQYFNTWAEPRLRLDGKYAVTLPLRMPRSTFVNDQIEVYQTDWFEYDEGNV